MMKARVTIKWLGQITGDNRIWGACLTRPVLMGEPRRVLMAGRRVLNPTLEGSPLVALPW